MTPNPPFCSPIQRLNWRTTALAAGALLAATVMNGAGAQAATAFNVNPDNIALGNQETIVEDGMQFLEPTAIPFSIFFDNTTGQNAIGSPLPASNIIFSDAGLANPFLQPQAGGPTFILTSFKLRAVVGGSDVRQVPVSVHAIDPTQGGLTILSVTGGEIIDLVPLLGLDGMILHSLTWSSSNNIPIAFLGATGFNGDLTTTSAVPVPAALPLMASVLGFGLIVARRRKKQSADA